MAQIKVIYKNANGYDQEHSESADTIQFASFKTATKELTDAKLADLIDGADANDQHIHDARYFRENEHIAATTGVADAGKPVKTAASGYINPLIDVASLNSALDHGTLAGLGDDDHTIYTKADGTRDFSGIVKYASHPSFTTDTQIVDKKYVDDKITTVVNGIEWQDSVISRSATPPGSPVTGDRYLVIATATGAWAGQEDKIATWNGSAWVFTSPTVGMAVSVDNEPTVLYFWGGSSWDAKSFEATTASTGLVKVGMDIRLDASSAGNGLGFSAGVLSVNVDNSSIEINADTLRVKALGIKDTMIDFGTGAGQVSASDIPILDAGNYTAQTQVEGALQELYGLVAQTGVAYTVGVGGVTKGFPLYVSAANTASEFGALSSTARIIGVADATWTAGQTVKSLANDTVVTGVLSGATAGGVVYWDGTALTQTQPTGSGSHVWKLGVAKNAADLHVEVEFIKKNA